MSNTASYTVNSLVSLITRNSQYQTTSPPQIWIVQNDYITGSTSIIMTSTLSPPTAPKTLFLLSGSGPSSIIYTAFTLRKPPIWKEKTIITYTNATNPFVGSVNFNNFIFYSPTQFLFQSPPTQWPITISAHIQQYIQLPNPIFFVVEFFISAEKAGWQMVKSRLTITNILIILASAVITWGVGDLICPNPPPVGTAIDGGPTWFPADPAGINPDLDFYTIPPDGPVMTFTPVDPIPGPDIPVTTNPTPAGIPIGFPPPTAPLVFGASAGTSTSPLVLTNFADAAVGKFYDLIITNYNFIIKP